MPSPALQPNQQSLQALAVPYIAKGVPAINEPIKKLFPKLRFVFIEPICWYLKVVCFAFLPTNISESETFKIYPFQFYDLIDRIFLQIIFFVLNLYMK